MDFDLDDPLGDLLSDDSNDSFFQITKKRSSNTQEKKSLQSGKHVPKVGDLFGIDAEPSESINEKTDKSLLQVSPARKAIRETNIASGSRSVTGASIAPPSNVNETTKSVIERQTLSNVGRQLSTNSRNSLGTSTPEQKNRNLTKTNSADDLLDELGFDPKNTKTVSGQKSNIFGDMLNIGDIAGNTNTSNITNTLTQKTSTESKSLLNNTSDDRIRSRESQKSANVDSGFSNNSNLLGMNTRQSSTDTRSNRTKSAATSKPLNTFDWLGLDKENEPIEKIAKELPPTNTNTNKQQQKQQAQISTTHTESLKQSEVNPAPCQMSTTLENITLNNSEQLVKESCSNESLIQSLHQQANQLQTSISMKQQENVLLDMHRKQKLLIEQQEKQFNDLIQRQNQRQIQLEEQIQQQQQQINSYINTLLQQSTVYSLSTTQTDQYQTIGHLNQQQIHHMELEADVKRLELEKIRLEDTLENIRATHDQEIELVKSSHK